ncbi:MAG: diguanylate cyclase, partial [Dehalococcoidia bacterium]|nr:diguanylate cyclase [Dehalococcoidia bacterium]
DITERKRAEEERLRSAKRVEALHAIAQAVSRSLDMDEMLKHALDRVCEVMDADIGGIMLFDSQAGELILKAHSGMSEDLIGLLGLTKLEEEEIKRAIEHKEPVLELDKVFSEANTARIAAAMEKERLQAYITVPLWSRGVPLGSLVVADHRERQFSAEEIDLLKAIGNEIAVGIENAILLERTRELSITDELTGLYNRRHFYETLESEVQRTLRYGRSFSLAMLDLDGFKEYNDRFGHASGDGVLQSFAQTLKASLRKSDISFRYGGDEFTVILPATDTNRAKQIIDRTRAKWLQTIESQYPAVETPLGFSAGIAQFPEDAETGDGLVFLADSALYFAKREGGYRAVLVSDLSTIPPDVLTTATLDQVYALAATVDARDPFTYGHSGRVADITQRIGKDIGLAERELADLYAASLLHDVGKVGVPDAILTKPDALTKEEWEIIKKHSAEGARIVGYARELVALVPMIRHHHEFYDGTGHPNGLKGEEIPLGARIISVADAYDTMTTTRTYREVVSQQEALEELRRYAGTQFDPELVEALCRAMNEANRRVKKRMPVVK